jgi:hypothetical protein
MNANIESFEQPLIATAEEKIDLWKKCDVNKLVEHFHAYKKTHSQFERLNMVSLTKKQIAKLFNSNKTIKSFDVFFGLDKKTSPTDEFTFRPTITVQYSNNSSLTMEFRHGKEINPKTSAVVPHQFKEWLTKNWMELDGSLIDDVFGSFFPTTGPKNPILPQMRKPQRLLGYHFTKEHNTEFLDFINKSKKKIQQFWFHLGVDMNKSGHEKEFVFSPVFEVHTPVLRREDIVSVHRSGLRTTPLKNTKNVILNEAVYYEYLKPCPSTCP